MDGRGPQDSSGARELTAKQARFIDEYLVDGNGRQAAIRAGYAERSAQQLASQLLQKPHVTAALAERRATLAAAADLDAMWVMRQLREVVERCLQAVPVRDRSGIETGEWRFDPAGATRALALIGKQLGMFSDRVDLHVLRREAAQIAAEYGLDEREVIDEAERWLKRLRGPGI